jgi:hypothetical protein
MKAENLRRILGEPDPKSQLRALLGEMDKDEEDKSPATGEELMELAKRMEEKHTFRPFELVTWKPGLRNASTPEYGQPAIVMRLLDKRISDPQAEMHSNAWADECDIIVGVKVEGHFAEYPMDSRRMMPLPALPAPDHNTCAT